MNCSTVSKTPSLTPPYLKKESETSGRRFCPSQPVYFLSPELCSRQLTTEEAVTQAPSITQKPEGAFHHEEGMHTDSPGQPVGYVTLFDYDMFIYHGKIYASYMYYAPLSGFFGEKVGAITHCHELIEYACYSEMELEAEDPEFNIDDYELMGTCSDGNIYSVKGYDPEIMLCMRNIDGSIKIYINNGEETLGSVRSFTEDLFGISDRVTAVAYSGSTNYDEKIGSDQYELLRTDYREAIDAFIEGLDNGEMIESLPEYDYTDKRYFFRLVLSDGMDMSIVMFEDGNVIVQSGSLFQSAGIEAVRVDKKAIVPLKSLMKKNKGNNLGVPMKYGYSIEYCRADETLGILVPEKIPKGFRLKSIHIDYGFDPETGVITEAKRFYIIYYNPSTEAGIYLEIMNNDKFENEFAYYVSKGGEVKDIGSFTIRDAIIDEHGAGYAAAVSGDVGFYIRSVDATANDLFKLIDSIRR